MKKVLHPKDDRLYTSRKKPTSIKDYVDASMQGLEKYAKKNEESLIRATSKSNDNIRTHQKKQQKIENINGKKNQPYDCFAGVAIKSSYHHPWLYFLNTIY